MAPNGRTQNRKKHKAADGGMAPPAPGVNGSKWTHTKHKKNKKKQSRRRGGMAPPAPGENRGPLKSENDLEGSTFFYI